MPIDYTPEKAQRIVTDVAINGGIITNPKRRRYDNSKFAGLFEQDDGGDDIHVGAEVFNRFITSSRRCFLRYLWISDEDVIELINSAVGESVDSTSIQFATMYQKIMVWRKNWFQNYSRAADRIRQKIEHDFMWADKTSDALQAAYKTKFSYEYWFELMQKVHAGTVDWNQTMKKKKLNAFFHTLFTFTMVYLHRSIHFPQLMTRKDAHEAIRLMARREKFKDISINDYVFFPVVPPKSQHSSRKDKVSDIMTMDPDFDIIVESDDEDPSTHLGLLRQNSTNLLGSIGPVPVVGLGGTGVGSNVTGLGDGVGADSAMPPTGSSS